MTQASNTTAVGICNNICCDVVHDYIENQPRYPSETEQSNLRPPTFSHFPTSSNSLPNPSEKSLAGAAPLISSDVVPDTITNGSRRPRSCTRCSEKKLRCDKISPCSNCIKSCSGCVFPIPRPVHQKLTRDKLISALRDREAELQQEVRRLEGLVKDLSGQSGSKGSRTTLVSARADGNYAENSEAERTPWNQTQESGIAGQSSSAHLFMSRAKGFDEHEVNDNIIPELGRLVIDEGKSRYISDTLWASLSNESEDVKELLADEEFADSSATSNDEPPWSYGDEQRFPFGSSSTVGSLRSFHPLPSQIQCYWQFFVENVDPLTRILHKPTVNQIVNDASQNLNILSRSKEALMFAIYFATITSIKDEDVEIIFGQARSDLLSRYRFALEQALVRASFLNSQDLITLQAFVILLVCIRRQNDTHLVWTLTGLAIRIAKSLGLHRDGTTFGLSPYDTEIRRRLWWQCCVLDLRICEDHGSYSTVMNDFFDTRLPLNINDDDLNLDTSEPPQPRVGLSEMTFCLVSYEICSLTRSIQSEISVTGSIRNSTQRSDLATKVKILEDFRDQLKAEYLQYCHPAEPLSVLANGLVRHVLAKMWLIIYHPFYRSAFSNAFPKELWDHLFLLAIDAIEFSSQFEITNVPPKWKWIFSTCVQWHPAAFVLENLCCREHSDFSIRAWKVIDTIFNNCRPADTDKRQGPLWRSMQKLISRAQNKRDQDIMARMASMTKEKGFASIEGACWDPREVPTAQAAALADETQESDGMAGTLQCLPDEHLMPLIMEGFALEPATGAFQDQFWQQQPLETPWFLTNIPSVDLEAYIPDDNTNWENWNNISSSHMGLW